MTRSWCPGAGCGSLTSMDTPPFTSSTPTPRTRADTCAGASNNNIDPTNNNNINIDHTTNDNINIDHTNNNNIDYTFMYF